MSGKTLGALIGAIRRDRRWTLKEMSGRVGVPLSTLAKIEADQLSLAFEKLQDVAARLGLSMAEFLAYDEASPGLRSAPKTVRRSVSSEGTSLKVRAGDSDFEFLCVDLKNKLMNPYLITVHAGAVRDHVPLSAGKGDEFIYVVRGKIEVHSEFYNEIVLNEGDSIYLDGAMKHAYIAKDCDAAVLLGVSSEAPDLMGARL